MINRFQRLGYRLNDEMTRELQEGRSEAEVLAGVSLDGIDWRWHSNVHSIRLPAHRWFRTVLVLERKRPMCNDSSRAR